MTKERAIEVLEDLLLWLHSDGIRMNNNMDLLRAIHVACIAIKKLPDVPHNGIMVGDICRYKSRDAHTDAREFIVTNIRIGQNGLGETEYFFDAIFPDGTVLEDGTLSLIERVGGKVDVYSLLSQIKKEM